MRWFAHLASRHSPVLERGEFTRTQICILVVVTTQPTLASCVAHRALDTLLSLWWQPSLLPRCRALLYRCNLRVLESELRDGMYGGRTVSGVVWCGLPFGFRNHIAGSTDTYRCRRRRDRREATLPTVY